MRMTSGKKKYCIKSSFEGKKLISVKKEYFYHIKFLRYHDLL